MGIYTRADRTSNVTTANACYEIIGAAGGITEILQIDISLVTAAATVIGIGRPAVIGITPTTPLLVQANIFGEPAGVTATAMAWGTGPTVPTHFVRRISFPATVGALFSTSFVYQTTRQGSSGPLSIGRLLIPAGGSIVLWNILGGATLDVNVTVSEN